MRAPRLPELLQDSAGVGGGGTAAPARPSPQRVGWEWQARKWKGAFLQFPYHRQERAEL